jgi:hypothetical protein
MSTVNVSVEVSNVLKANINRPGWDVNNYADSDFRRPPAARPMKDTIADIMPGFVRINDGFQLDETSLLLKPGYTTEGAQVFISGYSCYPSNDPKITKPSWIIPGVSVASGTLLPTELSNLCPADSKIVCGLAFNSMYANISGNSINYAAQKAELMAHANALVHYNLSSNLGITHWEIGNESIGYSGGAVAGAPNLAVYIPDVQEFIDLVHTADPTAQVGANAFSVAQFKALCEGLSNVNYIIPHCYSPYGAPNTYPQYATFGNVNLAAPTRFAVEGKNTSNLSTEAKANIQVITTEAATIDFSPYPYPRTNNLGLGLLQFDQIGQHIANVWIDGVTMWNSRGFVQGRDGLPHLLNPLNDITPRGHALSLWTKNIPRDSGIVFTNRDLTGMFCYAAANTTTTVLWLVNKKESTTVTANVFLTSNLRCVSREIFTANAYTSLTPTRSANTIPGFGDLGVLYGGNVTLPPVSISVLQFGTYQDLWMPTANLVVSSQPIGTLKKPGISMSAILDSDLNRPNANVSFQNAMKDLSPAAIRYPGGSLTVGFSWASSPFTTPSATLTRISASDFPSNNSLFWTTPNVAGGNLINCVQYNEFVNTCAYANARVIAQTDLDSLFMTQTGITPSLANITASAAGLITYNAGSNVMYETGWHPYASTTTFETTVNSLTANMKHMGAGAISCYGQNSTFWSLNLPNVDYAGVVNFPITNFSNLANFSANTTVYTADPYFDFFSQRTIQYTSLNTIASRSTGKPKVVLETNCYDQNKYNGGSGWPLANDVSRFLMAFEMIGSQLPGVEYLTYWNTRSYNSPNLFDILDNNNELLPTGWAVKAFCYGYDLLGSGGSFVATNSDTTALTVFAGTRNGRTVVWLSNKSRSAHPFRLNVDSLETLKSVMSYRGDQPTGTTITRETLSVSSFSKRSTYLLGTVAKFSITIFHF